MDTGYAGNTKYQKRGEMCKAIKDMLDESKAEGKFTTLIELVQEDSLSIEKAAAKANMTVEQFAKVVNTPRPTRRTRFPAQKKDERNP